MLKQRVITASTMMLTFLAVLFLLPSYVFLFFVGGVFLIGAWEWSNLSGIVSVFARLSYTGFLGALGVVLAVFSDSEIGHAAVQPILVFACFWWCAAFWIVNRFPSGESVLRSVTVRAVMGVFVLIPAWLSVVFLRAAENGALVVLLCLLVVAAADVGAYFSGRRFGKRKLAPKVSPGKSWEGAWGGMLLAAFVSVSYVAVFGELDLFKLMLVALPAALLSVIGDLLESVVKRIRGVKDSGTILPGHGGILDRVDGVVSAAPVFALCVLLTQWKL